MFDHYTIKPTQHVPTTVHHHENRAPTDDSIRLAEEYREKARRELVRTVRTDDNKLSSVWQVFAEPLSAQWVIHGKWTLNGQEKNITLRLDMDETNQRDTFKKIHETITREVAAHLTIDMMKTDDTMQLMLPRT